MDVAAVLLLFFLSAISLASLLPRPAVARGSLSRAEIAGLLQSLFMNPAKFLSTSPPFAATSHSVVICLWDQWR